MFNYENGINDKTLRELIEKNNQMLNIGSAHLNKMKLFNYDNKTKQTLRQLMEETKHITNIMDTISQKGKLYNFENGTPNTTLREMNEINNNITGFKSAISTQSRSHSDVENAYFNTQREKGLERREPVEVKHNRGKITNFTDYAFKDDNNSVCSINSNSSYKPPLNIKNDLYSFR
jgi:hypothetical protein